MLKQMNDHVYRLTLNHLRQTVNSYLIKGNKGFTVLDTGPGTEEAKNAWQKLMADGFTIEKVVITHGHPDHIGLASWFQQQVKVPVIFSGIGFALLKDLLRKIREAADGGNNPSGFILQHGGPAIPEKLLWENFVKEYFEPDDVYEPGSFIEIGDRTYQAIWTPGHARDQFCFWNEDLKLLFSSDHVLGHLPPAITTWSENDGNPLQDYLDSLQLLQRYRPNLVLPGHDEPIADLQQRLAKLSQGHFRRLEQIADILKQGEQTAAQISLEIYGGKSQGFLVVLELLSTVSRLVYLREAGKVSGERKDDGKIYFSLIQRAG